MTALQFAGFLAGLIPAVVTIAGISVATRREGPHPTETLVMTAYREHRQCTTAIYTISGGYPDRCAYPEDHYGECAP